MGLMEGYQAPKHKRGLILARTTPIPETGRRVARCPPPNPIWVGVYSKTLAVLIVLDVRYVFFCTCYTKVFNGADAMRPRSDADFRDIRQ